jgi:hypothetical protein
MPALRHLAVAAIATSLVAGIAFAASIPTTGATVGAGTSAVSACDPDGFTYQYTVDTSGKITTVTVGSIAVACAGGTLRLTLANGTTSVGSGSASLPASGFSGLAAITVSPSPASNQVTAAYTAIEGP